MNSSDCKILAKVMIQDSLLRHAKIYGVEFLEEKIKDVYSAVPALRDAFLKEYDEIFKNK